MLFKEASRIINQMYSWIVDKLSDNTVDNESVPLPDDVYDIYYYFKVLEKDKKLNGLIIENFNYPDSFFITIPKIHYKIKIDKCRKNNKICTSLYLNNKLVKPSYLGYEDGYREHLTYNSLKQEVMYIYRFMHGEDI